MFRHHLFCLKMTQQVVMDESESVELIAR